ncbi:Hop family adhesin SabA/HopD [Helicobacter acinonychis]|uniref:OMP435 n=1 Tax=Helicobacter acinonychis TaxID=212 RepID=A0A1M4NGW8_HELAC|nr:outer membrane protein [Helicobacter acinonychis]SFZ70483.1 OMP435 [Helicobacter acinonychis]STP03965.1 outer membrane protein 5 [Helicobacter acinonychis]
MNIKKTTLKTALLSFTLAATLLHAEDDGYFVSIGYQIGGSTQMVKNAGAIKNLNDQYELLNSYLAQIADLRSSILRANNTQAITSAISSLKSFAEGNQSNKDTSPIYNITQSIITSVTAMWQLIAGNKANIISLSQANCAQLVPVRHTICKATYEKLENYAKALETAASNLCPLSGCPTNGATGATAVATVEASSSSSSSSNSGSSSSTTNSNGTTIAEALQQAQALMVLLKQQDPFVQWDLFGKTKFGSGSKVTDANLQDGNITTFAFFNNIYQMLPLLQQALSSSTQNRNYTQNLQAEATGSGQSEQFKSNVYNAALTQQGVISDAKQIFGLFSSIPSEQLDYLQSAYFKLKSSCSASSGSSSSSSGSGNTGCQVPSNAKVVSLDAQISNIGNNVSYYGSATDTALQTSKDIYFLQQNTENIQNAYKNATNLSQEIQGLSYNKINVANIVTASVNKNAPAIDKYNYVINQAQQSEMNSALAAMAKNPFRNVGLINSQSSNGVMNGFGVQLGYKQFFGEKKRWGFRYYGFFDYNHTYIRSDIFSSASNVLTYGAASDFLYNFINDRQMNWFKKGGKFSFGAYGGIALAGTSWLNQDKVILFNTPQANASNTPYKADVSSSNFQFLFNFGVRANFAENSKGKHAIQHGIELGLKIPTINTNYYSFLGSKLSFRRTFSFYLNYVFAY